MRKNKKIEWKLLKALEELKRNQVNINLWWMAFKSIKKFIFYLMWDGKNRSIDLWI